MQKLSYKFYLPLKQSALNPTISDKAIYLEFKSYLKNLKIIKEARGKLERYIVTVLQVAKRDDYQLTTSISFSKNKDFLNKDATNAYMTDEYYINSAISHIMYYTGEYIETIRDEEADLIDAFKKLCNLKNTFSEKWIFQGKNQSGTSEVNYILGDGEFLEMIDNEPELFPNSYLEEICKAIVTIRNTDLYVKERLTSFFAKKPSPILTEMSPDNIIEWRRSIYTKFKKVFFKLSNRKRLGSRDTRELSFFPNSDNRGYIILEDRVEAINSNKAINLIEFPEASKVFGRMPILTEGLINSTIEDMLFKDPNFFDE